MGSAIVAKHLLLTQYDDHSYYQSRQKLKAVEVNVSQNRHAPFAQQFIEDKRRQQQP